MKKNNMKRFVSCILVVMILVALMPITTVATTAVTLGDAGKFVVLGSSAVTDDPPDHSVVSTGLVGVSPGSSITGFSSGVAIEIKSPLANRAHDDLLALYDVLKGITPATSNGVELAGKTLTPGVYQFTSEAKLTGTLTLDAEGDPNALFIFQIGSTLITAADSTVTLTNDAQPGNVFWQVGSAATLGERTKFRGNIIANQDISTNSGTDVIGRLLSCNAAVTLINTTIKLPPQYKEAKPTVSIDYISESLTGFAIGGSYSFSESTSYTVSGGAIQIADGWMDGTDLSIVKDGIGDNSDSAAQVLTIPARPASPTVGGVNATTVTSYGSITGVTDLMEYRKVGDLDWSSCSGGAITGITPAAYEVRVKAVTGSAFASSPVEVTIYSYAEYAGIKADLGALIKEAKALRDSPEGKNIGSSGGQYPQSEVEKLKTAIGDAEEFVADDSSSKTAIGDLQDAIDAFTDSKIPKKSSSSTSGRTTSDATVTETDIAQKGIINITKTGEIFSAVTKNGDRYQPVYKVVELEGAIYEIRAAKDIFSLDGTLRYSKDKVVDTVTTDKNGGASKALYAGKFKVTEVQAPYSMILSDKVHEVELVPTGQKTYVAETAIGFYNERQHVQISFNKSLEQDWRLGIGMNGEIYDVTFGLFAATELRAADATFIPKDALIEIISLDKGGHGVCKTDIPVGSSLYLRELSTNASYTLTNVKYPVVFEYGGQDKAFVIGGVANDGKAIGNTLIRGEIKVIAKPVDTATPGSGVPVTVQGANGIYDTPRTGDGSNLALWLAIMFVSAIGAAVLGFMGFKKKKRT